MSSAIQALSKTHYSTVTFVKADATTQYTAGDVICNAATLIFPGAIRNGSGLLNFATITTSNNATAKPTLELWLFDTTITAVADNVAFAPTGPDDGTGSAMTETVVHNHRLGIRP